MVSRDDRWQNLYLKWMNIVNYAVVCGIGVLINMLVIHGLIRFLPLWLANFGAIICAFLWNYSMSVGAFGYLWGFKPKPEKK